MAGCSLEVLLGPFDAADDSAAEKKLLDAVASSPGLVSFGSYAQHLEVYGKLQEADQYYAKALECMVELKESQHLAQTCSLYAAHYAQLKENMKEVDAAERLYKQALEITPNDCLALGNYAIFLHRARKDHARAEEAYLAAIAAHPSHASIMGKYANFLKHVRGDYDGAEKFYVKAIRANPQSADNLGNYAVLLHGVRSNFPEAEKYYLQAIQAEPLHTNNLGRSSCLLYYIL